MSTVVHVILSGSDPRVSSKEQFMLAYSGKSLFQLCVERNASFADRQLIVGLSEYYMQAREYFKLAGNKTYLNIIEEDHFTNIYSVAFAAFSAGAEEILLVTPSHYIIDNDLTYKNAIEKIMQYATHDQIGILAFGSDQTIDNTAVLEYKEDKIILAESNLNNKQVKKILSSKNHVVYTGILCCKAGVYLKELKALAPEVFKTAQAIWSARIGQYVSIEEKIQIKLVSIEEDMLLASDKVKLLTHLSLKADVPTKNSKLAL